MPDDQRLANIEAWWALVTRVLSFLLGCTILGWQAFIATEDRLWIIIAGVGLCGPTVAVSVATVIEAFRSSELAKDTQPPT